MIISHRFRYLFIETPHTGSTAISAELIANYDGQEVLHKHANYHEFAASPEGAAAGDYYVFAGVRNPLDEAVSLYQKFLNNHKGNYTTPERWLENGGWVTRRKRDIYALVQQSRDFGLFVERFYTLPYTSNINLNKKHCQRVLRFETLGSDFMAALEDMGIEPQRELPVVNRTDDKPSFESEFQPGTYGRCSKVFGGFMREWGYRLPNGDVPEVGWVDRLKYTLAKRGRMFYAKTIMGGGLPFVRALRTRLE